MSIHNVQFPPAISYGAVSVPMHSTAVDETGGGNESRIGRWSGARRRFDASTGIRDAADVAEILTFNLNRSGRLYGFRWKDWIDYSTASDNIATPGILDQLLGVGDGSETEFQLIKTYTSGVTAIVRNITRPVSGTVRMAVNGVEAFEGVDFTVNYETGIVTSSVAITLGLEVTGGCEFDVPARFDADELEMKIDAFEQGSIPNIDIVEIVDDTLIVEDQYVGGWINLGAIAIDTTLSKASGLGQTFSPSSGGLKLILPDKALMNLGALHFILYNVHATNSIGLYDSDGVTLIHTLTALGLFEVVLRLDSASTRVWDVIA